MSNQEKHLYEFGPFRLDPVKRRLLRDGEPVQISPKAFDTLLALVQQSGKTIEKDDLMNKVWPGAAVEENNLNQNISSLRRTLGDSRHESQYIATIPGLGYRFVAEVKKAPFGEVELTVDGRGQSRPIVEERVEQGKDEQIQEPDLMAVGAENAGPVAATALKVDTSERDESLSPPAPPSGESIIASLKRHRKAAALVLALIIIGAAAIAFLLYKVIAPDRTETDANEIEVTSLTRTGTTGRAAISPDGRYIIYSVDEAGRQSLWLRQVAASSAQQIILPAQVEYFGLTFSRDGNHVYFVRAEMNGSERALYRMPALGGVPVKLLADVHSPITLSPDGSRMAFVRDSRDESALMVANADGSDQRKLAARPMTDYFKVPAWSPDGKVIACSAGSGDPYDVHNSIVAVRVEDGNQRPASPQKWAWTRWVEWLADGSGLLITAREKHTGSDQIWHIAYPGGAARRITSDSKMYLSISLTADSQTLAAVQTQLHSDIWVAPDADAARARKVTFGTGTYVEVCYAPDGRIAYASQASGNLDIWMMNADGSGQKQLTADAGVNAHQAVSPDGRYIVFASNRAGVFNIWRMDSDGGNPVRLTGGGGEKNPQFSPDGKWVVYTSVSSDESLYSLWKMSIDGGEPVKLTDRDSGPPAVSPDGRQIAYMQGGGFAGNGYRIVIIPFAGGPPERTVAIPQDISPLPSLRWMPDGQALTYSAHRDGVSNIWRQPLDGGPAKQLTDFKAEGRLLFDWSRDGKQLVFTRRIWTSDLVLLRNLAPGKT
jgi:Tol biopolymer transport system component/DNA-binding winged helix-turn-helix (wHTH) protein